MTTDTQRLQWLFDQDGTIVLRKHSEFYTLWDVSNGLCLAGRGVTIQEAIDKAMTYIEGEWNE